MHEHITTKIAPPAH